jgi:primosomal protein N'
VGSGLEYGGHGEQPRWRVSGPIVGGEPRAVFERRVLAAIEQGRLDSGIANPETPVARVVLDHPSLEVSYSYAIPAELRGSVQPGSVVWVPSRNRKARGWVVGYDTGSDEDRCGDIDSLETRSNLELKPISGLVSPFPILSREQVSLAFALARYYLCEPRRFLRRMTPASPKAVRLLGEEEKREKKEQNDPGDFDVAGLLVEVFCDAGFELVGDKEGGREPGHSRSLGLDRPRMPAFLLVRHPAGVVPAKALATALGALAERSLGSIVALGSTLLSGGAQLREALWGAHIFMDATAPPRRQAQAWTEATRPGAIVVGDRAVVLQRGNRLGAVCVVDEASPTHREESSPYYSTRTAVAIRACVEGSTGVFLAPWHSYEARTLAGVALAPSPAGAASSSDGLVVEVIDRSNEPPHPGHISERAASLIGRVTSKGGRALVFVSRKGLYQAIRCRDCGFVTSAESSARCRRCNSTAISPASPGIQAIAGELSNLLPGREIAVVTKDTDSHDPGARVLVATEAAFFRVSGADLVVLQSFETLVSLVSYESWWKAMRVLYDLEGLVARRVNRTEPGYLAVQCFDPAHPVLQAFTSGSPDELARMDLADRAKFWLPPFSAAVMVEGTGDEGKALVEEALECAKTAASAHIRSIMGPHREGNRTRALLLHDGQADLYRPFLALRRKAAARGIRFRIEVDPDFSYRKI